MNPHRFENVYYYLASSSYYYYETALHLLKRLLDKSLLNLIEDSSVLRKCTVDVRLCIITWLDLNGIMLSCFAYIQSEPFISANMFYNLLASC
ncbi:hypothetical protein L1887_29550 [Cichorium endivia]|nr:hypothetical protein L1887_29550 [Cichorium endivia]